MNFFLSLFILFPALAFAQGSTSTAQTGARLGFPVLTFCSSKRPVCVKATADTGTGSLVKNLYSFSHTKVEVFRGPKGSVKLYEIKDAIGYVDFELKVAYFTSDHGTITIDL